MLSGSEIGFIEQYSYYSRAMLR